MAAAAAFESSRARSPQVGRHIASSIQRACSGAHGKDRSRWLCRRLIRTTLPACDRLFGGQPVAGTRVGSSVWGSRSDLPPADRTDKFPYAVVVDPRDPVNELLEGPDVYELA